MCDSAGGVARVRAINAIRESRCDPLERDTLYRPVARTAATFTVLV
jgi:hypothetical protein